ncbi:hypothetical protein K469DRAFT_198570 [Zopfia rhizophila CBS 207.26]|uniref:Uncharacterized protein n=1 Tax=Zopfia rhizophila CBS 207.26 TaxID=1314779 RepID=A0A6A6E2E6_9PEZI|nr:hypothetical protein K469DRAFT_198570 [Zopfia rhizophila CBS 207.26]
MLKVSSLSITELKCLSLRFNMHIRISILPAISGLEKIRRCLHDLLLYAMFCLKISLLSPCWLWAPFERGFRPRTKCKHRFEIFIRAEGRALSENDWQALAVGRETLSGFPSRYSGPPCWTQHSSPLVQLAPTPGPGCLATSLRGAEACCLSYDYKFPHTEQRALSLLQPSSITHTAQT